ncbi:hypothetical protein CIK05_13850 [Bdellovibrio sp. qaytius]|nr:hypothetical protein CIK05_13850 [Bdellovibrio sp. qaytius]
MKKKFFRSFLTFLISSQFYFSYTYADDTPPALPTDPVIAPELVVSVLNEVDSKELFDVLNKWKLVVTDRETQIKSIKTSEVVCVENLEEGRMVGCSLYDDLGAREITKHDKFADPLFKFMAQHVTMDCEDDSETCLASAEKVVCSLAALKYSCTVEYLVPQPELKQKSKIGDLK